MSQESWDIFQNGSILTTSPGKILIANSWLESWVLTLTRPFATEVFLFTTFLLQRFTFHPPSSGAPDLDDVVITLTRSPSPFRVRVESRSWTCAIQCILSACKQLNRDAIIMPIALFLYVNIYIWVDYLLWPSSEVIIESNSFTIISSRRPNRASLSGLLWAPIASSPTSPLRKSEIVECHWATGMVELVGPACWPHATWWNHAT